jgi:hypothetical protein
VKLGSKHDVEGLFVVQQSGNLVPQESSYPRERRRGGAAHVGRDEDVIEGEERMTFG